MPKKICLISKNARAYDLFRASWVKSIEDKGYRTVIINRGNGFWCSLKAYCKVVCNFFKMKLVFGVSEILLYLPVLKKKDILIFTGLGRLLSDKDVLQTALFRYINFFYRGQMVIVLNTDDEKLLKKKLGVSPVLISGEGYKFDRRLGEKNKVFTIAYSGRLVKSKGYIDFLNLIERFTGRCCFVIMGDRDYGNSDAVPVNFENKVIGQSRNEIRKLGFISDVKKELATVDIFISMSEREGMPYSVLDAIDSGCLLILSDVPGHRDFFGIEGVHIIQPNELLGLVEMIYADRNLLRFDRHNRINNCEEKYGFDNIVSNIKSKVLVSL